MHYMHFPNLVQQRYMSSKSLYKEQHRREVYKAQGCPR